MPPAKQTPPARGTRVAARPASAGRVRAGSLRRLPLRPLMAGALALAVGLGAGTVLARSGEEQVSSPPPPVSPSPTGTPSPGEAWRDAALLDLRPLTGVAVEMTRAVEDWRAGRASASGTAVQLERYVFELTEARKAIAVRSPLPAAPRARNDYQLTAALYLQAGRLARAATDLPDGPLPRQLQLSFNRLRLLADRFFEEADAQIEAVTGGRPPVEGVTVVRNPDVPEWTSLGLAAGPPLTARSAAPAPRRTFEPRRPETPFPSWRSSVQGAGLPTGPDEARILAVGSQQELQELARRLTAASDVLHAQPDPVGERALSTGLQLALLVHAEAARAAQASRLAAPVARAALAEVALELAAAADLLWDPRLGVRSTGSR